MALTEAEKTELKKDILNAIKAESQGVDELAEVTSLDNIKSLPAMRGQEVVLAPVSLLKKPAEDAAATAKAAAATANNAASAANTAAGECRKCSRGCRYRCKYRECCRRRCECSGQGSHSGEKRLCKHRFSCIERCDSPFRWIY